MLTLPLACLLSFAPAHAASVAQLEDSLERLDGSEESLVALSEAIERVEQHGPDIAEDREALQALSSARLALTRVLLAVGELGRAKLAMDEAIRSSLGYPLDPDRFGPELMQLYEERKQELDARGHGVIRAACEQPCSLVIDEHPSPNPSKPLFLGRYRVWIVSADGHREQRSVDLQFAGQVERLRVGGSQPGDNSVVVGAVPLVAAHHSKPRLLPRWSSVLGATVGVGLMVAGTTLAVLHDRCVGGDDPSDPSDCSKLYHNTPQSQVLLGVGGGLLAAWGALLVYDEVRVGRARGHQAMLVWTLRF